MQNLPIRYTLNDILNMEDPILQKKLLGIKDNLILHSLVRAPETIVRKILNNISKRRAKSIVSDMERFKDISEKNILTARKNLIKNIFELEGLPEIESRESISTTIPDEVKIGKVYPQKNPKNLVSRRLSMSEAKVIWKRLEEKSVHLQETKKEKRAALGAYMIKKFIEK